MQVRRKYNHRRNPFRSEAGFATYYEIGVVAAKRLPAFHSYAEVGRELGITKQNAYTESVLALGKLLYRIARIIREVPEL